MARPSKKELEEDAKVVVKWVNKVRKECGLGRINKPRRGIREHYRACSLAMSLEGTPLQTIDQYKGTVLTEALGKNGKTQTYEIHFEDDHVVARFIRNFDKGLYPEYEIPKTPVNVKGEVVA